MPGNTATSAANTKVPAHVGWTRCSPLCSQAGKNRSSVFSCLGPTSCKRLCHHATAAGQWGSPSCLVAMCSQIASVHHHVYCVKCSEVGAVSQDVGKNVSPARVSNLSCSLIGQRGMCIEPCTRVPNEKGWKGVKGSSAAIITW